MALLCSVKLAGADPMTNSKLSDLLKQAKDLGVPKVRCLADRCSCTALAESYHTEG
jgi:hypothetical protein